MFGPNAHLEYNTVVDHSHRDNKFLEDYCTLQSLFVNKFNLDDYDVLFISGSGTLGVESMFWSLKKCINVVGAEGSFTKRWKRLSKQYPTTSYHGTIDLFCQLETSVSHVYKKNGCAVDAVSSFPFYNIPKDTKIFATCSNKQLGSLTGLAIVCVKKDFWSNLRKCNEFSYLNLSRYKKYQAINQTPSTTPTYIYRHLIDTLDNFNINKLRNKITTNSEVITEAIGRDKIIGEKNCPVITIKKNHIPIGLAKKWNLYGLNSGGNNYHIFTYSCKNSDYERFANEYKRK